MPVAAPDQRFDYRPLWLVTLYCWATFGLYYVVWSWQNSRKLASLGRPAAPWAWAAGILIAPIGAYLIARFGIDAGALRGRTGRGRWWFAGLAFLVLSVAAARAEIMLPFLIALPVPLLLVQREMNAGWPRDRVATRLGWRDALGAAATAAFAALLWSADGPALRAWLSKPLPVGEPVSNARDEYRIAPPGWGWARVPRGTHGDSDSDLELQSRFSHSYVVVYRHENASVSLDQIMDARFDLVDAVHGVDQYTESRSLRALRDAELATVADARYAGSSFGASSVVRVHALRARGRAYEVIGSAESVRGEREISQLLDSFALVERAPGP